MKAITLDELIGNPQTYELRRSSQQQEETKTDLGIALKVMKKITQILMMKTWQCSLASSRSFSKGLRKTQERKTLAD